ncbi:RNA degradosome polyphosphate kinase [Paenibacillus mucilaginosus]|uniref:Polyphosphate kinase n=2 Tax=Paenibacillus mucilaginosus TaxID=61624 RepID=H6N9Z0_9BACL|nr:RNA degradosome polyphosphate kinase [Paenibacillus mucilaginosus]AEI39844.1 Polyphosphate kinase [Paenibacillus mucilaginosus KNP414]AFC28518.1 Polyphosphate kinase [Paenibacillus mucilaginosus 3016]MCG7217163.1 RNA degradosome polyphosphate kinase [Paenibacillus mucilaginosus]WDM29123.1 RNA degradosome polyphosphate kinase [Paenibacillus mucilaginosus]WFA17308.1 RNA degradosome polyphosphate kinase [Paenibacillus mucilaginosus]
MKETAPREAAAANHYLNRDLSWVEFNWRVLEEAQDPTTPLLERVKFLSIVSSNLDEFMSVRVAGIVDQIKAGYTKKDFTGYTPAGLFKRVMKRAAKMVAEQYRTSREITRALAREGIILTSYDELNATQRKAMDEYYHEIVFPVLTPMAVDQARPFPLVHTQSLYLAVVLMKEGEDPEVEPYFAILQVPSNLNRFIEVPCRTNSKKHEYILLETLIEHHIHTLFSGYTPVSVHGFRLTRNADLTLNEEGAEDLLEEIEIQLRRRRWGAPVRLEVQRGIHPYALQQLIEEFEISDNIFEIDGPIDLTFFMKLSGSLQGYDHLRYPPIKPVYPAELENEDDLFLKLRQQDVLVYHPYESFDAVTDFVTQAAHDPHVLAIKMTLYRVSGNSPLIQGLAQAAESGKQVTVVVELKARFDEERNIAWARKLEQSGCHVVYGLVGLKTHAKITLVVRQEPDGLRRYVHVGTGNYNDNTAKLYTDVGLFTTDKIIGEDASALFNEVTGYSAPHNWKAFGVAPTDLMDKLIEKIRREARNASEGKPARIIAKFNSLSNQQMVDELYAASQAGVKIDLIIRGVCCLRPGVPGLSENITVRSIVDRFLEHSRIFYFENGGSEEIYLASADWMTRNLTRRVELMCPAFNKGIQQSLTRILQLNLDDNVKARQLQSNGMYERMTPAAGEPPLRSQFEAMRISSWKTKAREF